MSYRIILDSNLYKLDAVNYALDQDSLESIPTQIFYDYYIANTPPSKAWTEWGNANNSGKLQTDPFASLTTWLGVSSLGDNALVKQGVWENISYSSDFLIERTSYGWKILETGLTQLPPNPAGGTKISDSAKPPVDVYITY